MQVASAQDYPARPVKIIVPFGPGSGSDVMARVFANELQAALGGAFIVENRAGASGIIAAEAVARSANDGYTLLMTSNTTHSANPGLFRSLPYDPVKDFAPVALLVDYPALMVINTGVPAQNIGEFMDWAKRNSGKVGFGYGNSTGQVVGEAIARATGTRMTSVSYKATPQALTDVVRGDLQFIVADLVSIQPFLKSGRVRAIAVANPQRTDLAPGVPTLRETVLPDLRTAYWGGMFAPTGTPREIVARLHAVLNKALARPDIRERLSGLGAVPRPVSLEEFGSFVREQVDIWAKSIREAGIEPQ
jgi:tripartite-type tricarboxylate transporter receptor subunit TctC